jgi:hypothetical protein
MDRFPTLVFILANILGCSSDKKGRKILNYTLYLPDSNKRDHLVFTSFLIGVTSPRYCCFNGTFPAFLFLAKTLSRWPESEITTGMLRIDRARPGILVYDFYVEK